MLVPRSRSDYASYDTSDLLFDDGAHVHFTRVFRYLGVTLSSSINDLADVESRIAAASGAFRKLESVFLSRKVKPRAKRAAYVAVVLPILIYGSEAWNLTEDMYAKLRRFHNYSTRRMCLLSRRYCWFNRISARYIQRRLGILDIDAYITRRHQRWAGHVDRMSEDRLPRRFLLCWVRNKRPNGCTHLRTRAGYPSPLRCSHKTTGLGAN